MSPCGPSKMTLIKKWPKFKNNLKSRSDGTAWAPKARRPTFGPLYIRPTILPFLCSCLFLVSMFVVGLCVLWVLCGPSKATARCYTSICDGIIWNSTEKLYCFWTTWHKSPQDPVNKCQDECILCTLVITDCGWSSTFYILKVEWC